MEWIARICCYCCFTYTVQVIFATIDFSSCMKFDRNLKTLHCVSISMSYTWNIIIIMIIFYLRNGYI